MSNEMTKAIARRVWEEVFNKRNLALADELLAPEAINHEAPPGVESRGPEGLKGAVRWLSAAFPDMHMAIDDVIAEGDKVVLLTTMSGTHQAPFWGIPPTGRHFACRHVHVVRIVDGIVVEHWAVRNDLEFLEQLGVMPEPSAAAGTVGQP
ncbi:MAG TPA: ester cyclase [Chloroflexota bacterium]